MDFLFNDIDDIGRLHTRLKKAQVPIVYGPGRHPISTSIFLYFLDPDGMTLEYSFGMEQFPEHDPRPPRRLDPAPLNVDSWGSYRDPRMSSVGEVASW